MRTINIYDLSVEIEYSYEGPSIGAVFIETGQVERLSAGVTITSVKAKGIEIISLLPDQQLLDLEEEILANISAQN